MAITVDKAKIGVILLGFLGVLLLVIGIVALSLFPSLFKTKLHQVKYLCFIFKCKFIRNISNKNSLTLDYY